VASDLDKLLGFLEVERVDTYLFVGKSPKRPSRIFGGQVAAQALNAAARSVEEDRFAHSMHAYFLRPGDPSKQIVYEVDPIRDGKSFNTRRVVAKQDGKAIFSTAVSFQVQEEGLSHQPTAPEVVGPENLESDYEYWVRMSEIDPEKYPAPVINPIERRPIDRRDALDPDPREPFQNTWVRGRGDLGDDLKRHQTLLAYFSDFALLGTALYPHPYSGWSDDIQGASLDHAIWFHRPFRADEYLLYCIDSPTAEAGRGFSRGSFYNQEGLLVASTAQESLIRVRKK
jgi:acyl-CoA thioesterase-2